MKNIMKKIVKLISAFVLSALVIFTDTQSVNAVQGSIKLGKATLLPGYIAGVRYNIKTLSNGGYAYCLNLKKKTAQNVTQYLKDQKNAGITYILKNGYPNKSFTGNKKKDFYITQAAVWWYIDDTTGTTYLSKSFKSTGSDKYGLRKYVIKLVEGAKKAKKKGYAKVSVNAKVSSSTMTLSTDKKYYVSKAIDANAKNVSNYKVSVSSAPKGTIITTTSGTKKSSFKPSEKFLIKIPASSVAEGKTVTAKVKINVSETSKRAYKYAPKNNSIQPMTVLQPYTDTDSSTISVKATKPKTVTPPVRIAPAKATIIKLDKDTNSAVAGAVLSIKNSKGQEVKRFTTTTESYQIDNLENGTYTVEELEAPEGYELSTAKETFTITDSVRNASVKFYNKAKDSVVSIIKLDKDTNNALDGAVLSIKNSNGEEVKRITSSVNGSTITGLKNGTYTVEELEAPEGYELSTAKETFTLSNTSKVVTVKFYNKAKDSSVSIIKLDKNTDNPIAGAVLVIKDANGNEIKRFTTTTNAYTITGLSNGTYTVEELEAPKGYELSTTKETFTISNDTKTAQVKFYNVPKDRIVTISKIDSVTGKFLPGAIIVVTNEAGEEVARFTSSNEAYVLNNLANGTYTVEEVDAPEGYFLNEESQTFTIDEEHLSYQITIKNVPKTCENGGLGDDECSVEVPDTGSNKTLLYLLGITIMTFGIGYVYKYNKAN